MFDRRAAAGCFLMLLTWVLTCFLNQLVCGTLCFLGAAAALRHRCHSRGCMSTPAAFACAATFLMWALKIEIAGIEHANAMTPSEQRYSNTGAYPMHISSLNVDESDVFLVLWEPPRATTDSDSRVLSAHTFDSAPSLSHQSRAVRSSSVRAT